MQIALLLPCYHSQKLSQTVTAVQAQIDICTKLWPQVGFQLWLIDDGAGSTLADEIAQLKVSVENAHKLCLSRHFGYDAAVLAGLASVAADAYVVIDPEQPTMIETMVSMIDALVVGGYQVVGFGNKRRMIFRNCAFTAQVKRALLQGASRHVFALSDLQDIGFKQKRLAWIGSLPKRQAPPWLLWVIAAVAVIALSFWPLGATVGNVILLGFCFTLWQRRQPGGPSYVISTID
ncbi:hypothetical protein [Lacticaseibacillus porcinae]|uniref:hypothetical protein n=1 Tax=Lacticaseibacillus porcinae TaxID=1123687 RepID=UPI000F79E92F|nr:hypothetical protein [Lacticaseibacillus porcinae]